MSIRLKVRDPETGGIVYVEVTEVGCDDPTEVGRDTGPDEELAEAVAEDLTRLGDIGWMVDRLSRNPDPMWAGVWFRD